MKKDKEKKAVKKLSKKMKSLFFLAAAILILIGASIYTVLIRPRLQEEKVSYEPTSVNRGTVRVTVNESGAIEYSQSSIMYELNLDVSDAKFWRRPDAKLRRWSDALRFWWEFIRWKQ